MTGRELDDAILEAFARRARQGKPTGLAAAILAQTTVTPQRRQVGAAGRIASSSFRLLAVAALAVAAIGLGGLVSGAPPPDPDPSPVPTPITGGFEESSFVRRFTYRLDAASGLVPAVQTARTFALVGSMKEAAPNGGPSPATWGITITDATDALVHPCPMGGGPSRVPIRSTPTGLLKDIGVVAGVATGPLESGLVDGRPSVSTRVDPSRNACDFADLHLSPGGLGSGSTRFDVPSVLTAIEVDGLLVLIQVWAPTDADLEANLPVGAAIVESLHFNGEAAVRLRAPRLSGITP